MEGDAKSMEWDGKGREKAKREVPSLWSSMCVLFFFFVSALWDCGRVEVWVAENRGLESIEGEELTVSHRLFCFCFVADCRSRPDRLDASASSSR